MKFTVAILGLLFFAQYSLADFQTDLWECTHLDEAGKVDYRFLLSEDEFGAVDLFTNGNPIDRGQIPVRNSIVFQGSSYNLIVDGENSKLVALKDTEILKQDQHLSISCVLK